MSIIRSSYPDVNIPQNGSLIDFVFEHYDKYGDSEAMVDGASGRSYTFSQIKELSFKVASALSRLGFKKGDVFGIVSPNLPEFGLILCGVARMGGVICGANPSYTEDELADQFGSVEARLIFTIPPLAEKGLKVKNRLSHIQDVYVFGESDGCKAFESLLADDGSAFPDVEISKDDTLELIFSSGTTGKPKGVIVTHGAIVWNLTQLESPHIFDTRQGETILALLPYYHIYSLVCILLHSLRAGARQVSIQRFGEEPFLKVVQEYKVNHLMLVPHLIMFLAKHPLVEKYDLSSVRQVISGAAPLANELAEAVMERLSIKCIRQGFGMSETGAISFLPRDVHVPSSIGKLIPNTDSKIVDIETGKLLGPDEDGELCVRGPQVTPGYYKNPEATANAIDSDGFIHTGDVCHYDSQGLFYIVDRLKEIIKYKGFQISPSELEALLITHPSISDVAVIGIHDDEAGEIPRAYVVRTNQELTADDVEEFVAKKVAPFKKLRGGVEFVETIPKSAAGKILRRVLRESLKA